MNTLGELLAMPDPALKRPEAWHRLTRSDTVFHTLLAARRSDVQPDWDQLNEALAGWGEEFVGYTPEQAIREKRLDQWYRLCSLLWCAEQAATYRDFYRTEIDRVCFAIANTPAFITRDKPWAWTCVRTFLEVLSRKVEVHAAVWDAPLGEDDGFILTLVLETLEGGPGELVHDLRDVFCTSVDDQFGDSMQDAWTAGRSVVGNQLGKGHQSLRCHGRWRLLLRGGQPIPAVAGRSASGAAARGWWFALRGKVPDPEVIVIAQIDAKGVLTGVASDGIRPKVKAIVKDGRFDTIVVASEENRLEAERTLRDEGNLGPIRVVKL